MISDMVKIMKGNTARWLFLKRPELKQSLCDGQESVVLCRDGQ